MMPRLPLVHSTFDVVRAASESVVKVRVAGAALLGSPLTNKGTAFTANERSELGLVGLLPPCIESLDQQVARAHTAYLRETTTLGRFQFLRRVQDTNEVLFYSLLRRNIH